MSEYKVSLLCSNIFEPKNNDITNILNRLISTFTSTFDKKILFISYVSDNEGRKNWNEVISTAVGEHAYTFDTPSLGENKKWGEIWKEFNAHDSSIFLHLSTQEMVKSYNNNNENKHLDRASYIKVHIKIHNDCLSIAKHINEKNSLNHLLINGCSESLYLNLIGRSNYFSSLSVISSKTEIAHDDPVFFDFERNILRVTDVDYLQHWVGMNFNQPRCYFSYASADNLNELMKDINWCINRYFPFVSFERDKDTKNYFKNINQYVDNLIEGDIIFFLIHEHYLSSYYAVLELYRTFKKFGLLGKTEKELLLDKNNLLSKLTKSGRFVLLSEKAAHNIRTQDDNDLRAAWIKSLNDSEIKMAYSTEDVESLYNSFSDIKKVLSCINTPSYLCDYYNSRYEHLVPHISKALDHSNKGYYDIYKNHASEKLPSLSKITTFKADRDITDIICSDSLKTN